MSSTERIQETAMPPPEGDMALYERDFHAWALDQGQRLRDFSAAGLRLPGIDLEHVAEEIEDLGSSERKSVESGLELAYRHMIIAAAMPDSDAMPHWVSEIQTFLGNAQRRYAPSMRRVLNNDLLWVEACSNALEVLYTYGVGGAINVPAKCPFDLEDLLVRRSDSSRNLIVRVRALIRS